MDPDQQVKLTVTLGQVDDGAVVASGSSTIMGDTAGMVSVPSAHTLDVSDGFTVWQVTVKFEEGP